MKVKELERTVNVAWSPANHHPILLAAGTAAQQLDASFSTSASLELYSLNLAEPGLDLELKCSVPSQNRFHNIVWGGGSPSGSAGVVVGGCDGGKLQMYNISKVLVGEDSLIQHQDRHSGPVRSLDFNPFQTNLLASGASESEIFIWDLNNTSTPMTPGAKAQPFEDVMSLAWNRQVQHILASTFATRCIVWDLRKNEPIIKLTDSNSRVRWKMAAWNPDVATQLCLASEEDSNPVVQLWDLRFATTPLKSFQAHTRGVLSIAWCSQDSDLLISTGKDNRIICWNPNSKHPTGEIQCEIGNTQQWIFEVSWCPRNPNLIASCSADSHTSIYNLTGAPTQSQTTNKIADSFPGMDPLNVDQPAAPATQSTVELVKPPKWMRRPGGASFSFGGKLVTFGGDGGSVMVSQVSTDSGYLDRAKNVLDMLSNGRAAELCGSRQDPVWSYLEATFAPRPYIAIKNLLGYSEVKSKSNESDVDNLNNQMAGLAQDDINVSNNNIMDDTFSNNLVNGTEVFDSISAKHDTSPTKKPTPKFQIPTGQDSEGSICKSLLVGDLEEAVNCCLTEGRCADALVLAMIAGSSLLDKTQQKYFNSQNGSSQVEHLIRAIVTNDWTDFVACCELVSWKEALVALLTYARHDCIPQLCEELGRRLEEVGGEFALGADVCYITAGSIGSIIRKKIADSNLSAPGAMQELVELVMVGEAAAMSQGKPISTDGEISDLFTDYALVLATQGDYQTALCYLQHTQGEQVNDLRDRLQANVGVKQEFQQPQYQQNQNRKFSGQQQQSAAHFAKMSPIGAMRSNAAASTLPVAYPSNDFSQSQPRPPSVPPPSHSPGLQHAGKKYLVDPSVGGTDNSADWGNKYYPTGNRRVSQETAPFQPQPAPYQPQPTPFQPPSGTFPQQSTPFQQLNPGSPGILNPMSQPSMSNSKRLLTSTQNYHSGKSGWNDPPVLTATSKSQYFEEKYGCKMSATHAGTKKWNRMIAKQPRDERALAGSPSGSDGTVDSLERNDGYFFDFKKAVPVEPKAPITSPLAPPPPDPYGANLAGMQPPGGARAPPSSFPPPQRFNPPPSIGGMGNAPPTGLYARQMESAPMHGSSFLGSAPPPPGGPLAPPTSGPLPPRPQNNRAANPLGPPQMGSLPPPPQMGATPPPQMGSLAPPPQVGSSQPTQMGSVPPPQMGSAPPPQIGSAPPPQMGTAPPPEMGSAPPTQMGSLPPSQMGTVPLSQMGIPPPHRPSDTPPMGLSQIPKSPSVGGVPPQPAPPPMGSVVPPGVGAPHPGIMQRPPSRLTQTPTPAPPTSAVPGFPHPPASSSPSPQMNGGYGNPPTPRHTAGPIPENLKPLQATLELLRVACFNASNNPQVKRKLEDVARKLEWLYEALRESKLSPETLSSLEELVAHSREGNYAGALGLHTRMISGPDFSQISPFMPALKVLIQTALQLNVYIQ